VFEVAAYALSGGCGLYESSNTGAGWWSLAGPLLIARLVGSVVAGVVLGLLSGLAASAPSGVGVYASVASLTSSWGLLVALVGAAVSGLVLRALLPGFSRLEIGVGRAVAVFLAGAAASAALLALLASGTSRSAGIATLSSDGHVIGTEYEGPKGCAGPAVPTLHP
jgi:hypothetical protein